MPNQTLDFTYSSPLEWPDGWAATDEPKEARFQVTPGQARDEMLDQLRRMNATDVKISTNLTASSAGKLLTRQPANLEDAGVAVYFTMNGREYVTACDRYRSPWHNMRGVGLSLEAIRTIERHGTSEIMMRAFKGLALPERASKPDHRTGGPAWWITLELSGPLASTEEIKNQYRKLSKRYHTDGSEPNPAKFLTIKAAYDEAMASPDVTNSVPGSNTTIQ